MGQTELVRLAPDAPHEKIVAAINAHTDLMLGNESTRLNLVGWDGELLDPNTGATLSSGNATLIADNASGNHADLGGGKLLVTDALVTVGTALKGTGAADFDSTFNADGAATFMSTVAVTGAATFSSTLHGIGAADFDSTLNADGAVTFTSTLDVTGHSTVTSLTATGNTLFGNADSDTSTVIGNFTVRNSASSMIPLFVDVTNNRAQFGTVTALGTTVTSKLEVVAGRAYFAGNSEDVAVGFRYGATTGTYFLGASNSADPALVFKDASGVEVVRFDNDTATYQVVVTGKSSQVVNATGVFAASISQSHTSGLGLSVVTAGSTFTDQALYVETNGSAKFVVYNDGSIVAGAPTGGAKGIGTINAKGVYDDGTILTDAALEPDYPYLTIPEMRAYYETHLHLPTIPGREAWEREGSFSLGKLATHLWETVEIQARYIAALDQRLVALEAA